MKKLSKRNHQLRREFILSTLRSDGRVNVDRLASELAISEVTIRKDLAALEQQGLLVRRYGGAVPLPSNSSSPDAESLASQDDSMQARIGRAAAELVEGHSRIIIDSGNTTAQLVPHLIQKVGLVVMSNSLRIVQPLTELSNGPTVLMPGGTWDRKTQSFQGQMSEQLLRAYDFDQLFVGADGIDLHRGTTTFNELINLSRVMADVSRRVIVMAESKKVARKIPNLELAWSQIDTFITDNQLSETDRKLITELGVEVLIA